MSTQKQSKERIFGLDVVRASAILFVVFSHLFYVADINNPTFISFSGLFGYFGVEVFFVLSGFLIGSILLKKYLTNDFSFAEIKTFLKRRWFRTLPAYYLVLLLNIILAIVFNYDYSNWWKYIFFIQNLFTYDIPFFRESWSLSVEEWTYLLLPFVLFFGGKLLKISKKFSFLILITALILVFHLFRYYAYLNLEVYEMDIWNTEIKSTVIYRVDAILVGFIIAWLHYFYSEFLYKLRVYFFIIAMHLFFFQFVVMNVLQFDLVTTPLYFKVFYFPFTSLIVALGIPFFIYWNSTIAIIQKPIEFLSKISYSMYLLHYSIIAVLFKYLLSYLNVSFSWYVLMAFYFLVTTILSYLLYRFFEKPIMDLRDK